MGVAYKILAVDDQEEHLEMLSTIISHHIETADFTGCTTGSEGLVLALESSPDLIIVDASMPEVDGFDVCRALRKQEQTANTPVLMLSGIHTESSDRVNGLDCGADAYLLKPYDHRELVAVARSLLRIKRYEDCLREERRRLYHDLDQKAIELRYNRGWLSQVMESVPAFVWALDPEGHLTFLDGRPTGPSRAQVDALKACVGETVFELMGDLVPDLREIFEKVVAGKTTRAEERIGTRSWEIIASLTKDEEGEVTGVLGIAIDVTMQHQTQVELARANDELCSLAARLSQVSESERNHVAHELHDDVCQVLSAISVKAASIEERLGKPDGDLKISDVADIRKLAEGAAGRTRDLMQRLRPLILEQLGLEAAVKFLCHEFARSEDTPIDTTIEELTIPISTDVSMVFFRIVQEALANIGRHASACTVSVNLYAQNQVLLMSIRDNGDGFDLDDCGGAGADGRWGLRGMRERALSVGAELVITSCIGSGTTIVVSHTPGR